MLDGRLNVERMSLEISVGYSSLLIEHLAMEKLTGLR